MDKAVQLCRDIGVSGDCALELAENIIFLTEKLSRTRALIQNMEVVIPYDNGGGQRGIRENPAYSAYQKLVRTYSKLVSEFEAIAHAQGCSVINIKAQIDTVAASPIAAAKQRYAITDNKSNKRVKKTKAKNA